MNRSLIMQMLSKLPPEKLGQLVSEAQNPQKVMDISPDKKVGFKGSLMPSMMRQQDKMYRGPVGRV